MWKDKAIAFDDESHKRNYWSSQTFFTTIRTYGSTVFIQRNVIEKQSILDFLESKVAKWWLPDEIIFLKELPHGATGKLQKFELRDEYTNYYMEK